MPAEIKYKRILLKLSGEALMGEADYGIDPKVITRLASEALEVQRAGVEVALVIGGGNIFRGEGLAKKGMDRVTGDHMGMLATVINALAMQDALEKLGARARVMSAIKINADLLLKATKVDGVYSADPKKDQNAQRFERLSYDQVIERKLAVMDTAAIALCRDHKVPLRIYDMSREGDLMRIIRGEQIGTLVS